MTRHKRLINKFGVTCQVQKSVKVKTSTGSKRNDKWVQVVELKGWIQPAGQQLIVEYGQRELQPTHAIYCYVDPQAEEGYRVVQGTNTYVILGVKDMAGLGRIWRLDVKG